MNLIITLDAYSVEISWRFSIFIDLNISKKVTGPQATIKFELANQIRKTSHFGSQEITYKAIYSSFVSWINCLAWMIYM